MPKRSNQLRGWLHALLHSSRGRDALLFLLFVCVSWAFWVILKLNDDVQKEVDVTLTIDDIPADVTFISEVPPTLSVSVRDKGASFLSYSWGATPSVHINFNEFTDAGKNRLLYSAQALSARVQSSFSTNTQVSGIRPDSLSLLYTNLPGRRVTVRVNSDVNPSLQCVISGPITVSPDTVTIYAANRIPASLRTVSTVELSLSNLIDTTTAEVRLEPIAGMRIVPDVVTVTVPVEPLISKSRTVPVTLAGTHSSSVVIFPSRVEVSYLVPMSMYNSEVGGISVVADYERRNPHTARIPLILGSTPDFCHNASLAVDSVEYLIEQ